MRRCFFLGFFGGAVKRPRKNNYSNRFIPNFATVCLRDKHTAPEKEAGNWYRMYLNKLKIEEKTYGELASMNINNFV